MTARSTVTSTGIPLAGMHPTVAATGGLSDAAAVRAEAAGDPAWTFEQIIDRYQDPLLRYAASLVDADDSQDVVQTALLRLHEHWRKHGRDSVEHLPTWLYRVTRNLAMDVLRRRAASRRFTLRWKQRAHQAEPTRPPQPAHVEDAEQAETLAATRRVLDEMPARERELLMLKAQHNLTVRQIAQVLNMPHSTAAYQFNRALADLARRLKEQSVL